MGHEAWPVDQLNFIQRFQALFFFGKLNFQLVEFKLFDSKVCIHGIGQGGFLTVIQPIFNWHKVQLFGYAT